MRTTEAGHGQQVTEPAPEPAPREPVPAWVSLLAALVGAGIGFAIAAPVYLMVDPILEDSGSWVRELQGLLWNLVPLLTLGGGLLAWWLVRTRWTRSGPADPG